jgi:hypothetical protein
VKPLRLFLVWTFGLFLAGFAAAGLLISIGSPDVVVTIVQIVMAWTPTFAFLIIRRKIEPDKTLLRSIADRFAARIRPAALLVAIFLPLAVTAVVWAGHSLIAGTPMLELVADVSAGGVAILFASHVIRGAVGEELGWRGYLQGELCKRHSLLGASLIVGVIWGLWHLPLWFVSGYQGVELLLYSASFLVAIVSFSVVIAFVHRGGNLLLPMILHLMFNFSGGLLALDTITIVVGSAIVYSIIAAAIAIASTSTPRQRRLRQAS